MLGNYIQQRGENNKVFKCFSLQLFNLEAPSISQDFGLFVLFLSYHTGNFTRHFEVKNQGKNHFSTIHSFRLLKLCVQRVKNFFLFYFTKHTKYTLYLTRAQLRALNPSTIYCTW